MRVSFILLASASVGLAAEGNLPPSPVGFPRELLALPAADAITTSVTWGNVPLRQALERLADATAAPIFLDRRVDPTEPVRLVVANRTVGALLSELVNARSLAVTSVGELYYVGPPQTCAWLRTLVAVRLQEAAQQSAELVDVLKVTSATNWPRLSTPRQLVVQLANEAGLAVRHPERIPHDLWPAGALPELSLAARLSILLAGFDLTFVYRSDGRNLEIIPIERPLKFRATYDVLAQQGVNVQRLQRRLPDAGVNIADGKLVLEGRWEQHQQLRQLLAETTTPRPSRRTARTDVRQVFTLRVRDQPLRDLMEQLAQRLDFAVVWHESAISQAGISLDERVSFELNDADLDAVLRAALAPVGLAFRRDGRTVEILPAPE
jgi:hypothetical protein